MPLYYFGLDNKRPPDQDGENLPTDEDARKFAELIAGDLGRNSSRQFRVSVFNADGKLIS